MDLFLAPESWPFTVAALLLVAIAVIEGLALLVGMSLSGWLDHFVPDAAHGVEGVSDSWLGWLHVGKVPLLVLMVLFLMGFSLSGFAIAGLTHSITGYWPPVILSVIPAIMFGIGCMKLLGNLIARLKITDQSTAVSELSLLGRVAIISEGNATTGMAAQAKVRDQYGQTSTNILSCFALHGITPFVEKSYGDTYRKFFPCR